MSPAPYSKLTVVAACVFVLAACGKHGGEEGGSQVAAKVNKAEITAHQLEYAITRANISPEQAKVAKHAVLDRLIEQELLVQQAVDKKLDRTPQVVLAIEAARREILARAYLEQIAATAAKPSDQEISDYYAKHPELFAERRIYSFREVAIEPAPGRDQLIKAQLEKSPNLEEFVDWLKSQNIRFAPNAFSKPAEQLPLDALARYHTMKDGQVSLTTGGNAIVVMQLMASKSEPVDLPHAKQAIGNYILSQRRGQAAQTEVKRLKAEAKIEYVGEYQNAAASAPVAAPTSESSPGPESAQSASAAQSAPTGSTLENGIKGLN